MSKFRPDSNMIWGWKVTVATLRRNSLTFFNTSFPSSEIYYYLTVFKIAKIQISNYSNFLAIPGFYFRQGILNIILDGECDKQKLIETKSSFAVYFYESRIIQKSLYNFWKTKYKIYYTEIKDLNWIVNITLIVICFHNCYKLII